MKKTPYVLMTDSGLSRAETCHLYDNLAGWYDLLAGSWENHLRLEALDNFNLKPGDTVLEIGAGTGEALLPLSRRVAPCGNVISIDLSSKMLMQARNKMKQHGLPQGVILVRGDAVRLPIGDAQVDGVFMSFTLELFSNPGIQAVLDECRRVLRTHGRLGLVSLSEKGTKTLATNIYIWAHRHFPRWLDCQPIKVQQFVEERGFQVTFSTLRSLWGLPVEIVLAEKPPGSEVVYG